MGKIINNIVVAIISIMIFSVHANADGQVNHVNGVWGSSANDVFVVGSDGMVLDYDGTAWTEMASNTSADLRGVWGNSANDVFVVGSGGMVLHYSGTDWTTMTSHTSADLRGVWGSSANDVFVVGSGGMILHYNGTDWTTMTSNTSADLRGVWGSSANDVFVVGSGGMVLHYNGTDWTTMASHTSADLRGVWGSSSDHIFAVGSDKIIYYNGADWITVTTLGSGKVLYGVWGSSADNVYVVGSGGMMIRYDGADWTMASYASEDFHGVWGSSANNIFVVGKDVYNYQLTDNEQEEYTLNVTVDPAAGGTVTSSVEMNNPDGTTVMGLSSDQRLTPGQSHSLQGTVYAGTGDRLTKVTAAVTGPGILESDSTAMTSGPIGMTSYSLSSFTFSTSAFSHIGTYTIGIWATTQEYPGASLIGSFQITVSEFASLLTVSGLSSDQQLTSGQSYSLQGTVYAGTGDRLTRVTAAVTGPGIPESDNTAMTSGPIGTTSYSLSSFTFSTSAFSHTGTYTIGIWASTQEYPGASFIGSFQITVTGDGSKRIHDKLWDVNGTSAVKTYSFHADISCPGDCTENYSSGTTVQLTASPAQGYQLDYWAGCDSTNRNRCTVNMDSDRNVTAVFKEAAHEEFTLNITVAPEEAGRFYVLPEECVLPLGECILSWLSLGECTLSSEECTLSSEEEHFENYNAGTKLILLNDEPDEGYLFESWTGCDSTSGNECTVTMDSFKSVKANFDKIETGYYTLGNIHQSSDRFSIWMDISVDGNASKSVCDDYEFEVVDEDGKTVAEQESCTFLSNQKTKLSDSERYRIEFEITQEGDNERARYFENGRVKICEKGSSSNCTKLPEDGLENLSVYGTTFDMGRHAWQFANGDWVRPSSAAYVFKNIFFKVGNVIDDYIINERRDVFWNSFGKNYLLDIKNAEGGCYGLTQSAIANFTHAEEDDEWGTDGTNGSDFDEKKWKADIDEHWSDSHAVKPFKPFDTDRIYDSSETFDQDNHWTVQSAKKIMYYHAATHYYTGVGDNWAGADVDRNIHNTLNKPSAQDALVDNLLKKGSPASLSILVSRLDGEELSEEKSGYHQLAITQVISWNGHIRHIIWDNNCPLDKSKCNSDKSDVAPYLSWYIEDTDSEAEYTASFSRDRGNSINYINGKGWGVKEIYGLKKSPIFLSPTIIGKLFFDSQNIYNLWPDTHKRESSDFPKLSRDLDEDITTDYSYPDHIEILIIGAQTPEVSEQSTGNTVTLIPYGELTPDQAVIQSSAGGIFNTLYLPADKSYRIEASKAPDFPGLKVFVTIPNSDGTVERLNYDDLETGETDPTHIYFFVGRDNADRDMRRSPTPSAEEETRAPDYDANLETRINPPGNFTGIYENNTVRLQWKNDSHPDFARVKIVRKQGGFIESSDDGTVVYEGQEEQTTDTGVSQGQFYNYAAYSMATDSDISEPAYLGTDTSRYTIYGQIATTDGTPVSGIGITLRDSEERFGDSSVSGPDGRYTLPNLENGEYLLEASDISHEIQNPSRTVILSSRNKEENFTASPKAALMLLSDMDRMLAGQTVYVQWAYRNIANDETVSITLKQGTSWQTLADSIPIVQGQTQWKLPETPGEDLLLRVSLKRDTSVYDETEFEIYVISPGDINHDGRVNLEDVLLSLQVCAGTDESVVYTDTEINSDGKIGIQEVIYILQVVAGIRD